MKLDETINELLVAKPSIEATIERLIDDGFSSFEAGFILRHVAHLARWAGSRSHAASSFLRFALRLRSSSRLVCHARNAVTAPAPKLNPT